MAYQQESHNEFPRYYLPDHGPYPDSNNANTNANATQNADGTPPNYQPVNHSWQQSPMHSPAPPQPPSMANGMQYPAGYQNHNIQGSNYSNISGYGAHALSQAQQRPSPYNMPIDPALMRRPDSTPLTSGSPANAFGASNAAGLANPASTVSPLALQNRPPPYRNPNIVVSLPRRSNLC